MIDDRPAIGVLGGMGPLATVTFLEMVMRHTPAERDWDHVRLIVDVNPHIPSRSRHIILGEESPVPLMIDTCRRLESYPVDAIAIPCNSACHFVGQIQPHIAIPILDIITITVRSLGRLSPLPRACLVLGGPVTYAGAAYEHALGMAGIGMVRPTRAQQNQVEELIEAVKLGRSARNTEEDIVALVREISQSLEFDAVILGCTELHISGDTLLGLPIRSSTEELAREVVKLGKFEGAS